MLSFDLRTLASNAIQVDGALASDDPTWIEGDDRPASTVSVSGRLSTAGSGRYYFSGHLTGELSTQCRRCLNPLTVPVSEDVHLLFVEADDEEANDPDVYLIDSKAQDLDMRPAIREQWVLAAPAFTLCRDDCAGLCATCGADRNTGDCRCAPSSDSRWDALRTVRSSTS